MIFIREFLVILFISFSLVQSLPFTIDVLENRDIIFPRRTELVKRTASNDVSELNQQKISLASFIENIETGILKTALSVDPLATDVHAEVQNTSTTTAHPIEKRSTNEDTNVSAVESSTPLVLVQTTENVPAVDTIPSHVVIDRVSVFKTPEVGGELFPTFVVQDTNESKETTEVSDDDVIGSTTPDNSSEESNSSESSEEKITKVKGSSSSVSLSTVSTVTSSTTPLSVEEKKTVEKELKEKVVEVEAEPVIFTARV